MTKKSDETRERTPEEIEMAAFLHDMAATAEATAARQVARKAEAEARQRTSAEAYAAMIASSDTGVGFTSAGSSSSFSLGGIGAMLPGSGCNIKGNISQSTGERIFHVPGQKYYQETRVSVMRGERWFCSEAEARKAGWRRSRV